MMEIGIGVILGGFFSWLSTHVYYKKSSTQIPDWAKPIVEKLPQSKPTDEELLQLFQEALDSRSAIPDPVLGHVACPECFSPSSDFHETSYGNDSHTVVIKTCPHCGWSDHTEV